MAASIESVQLQLNALSSSVDDHVTSISEDILNLNSTILLQKTQINNLEVQDEEHSEAIEGLQNSLQSLDSTLQSEIDALKTRLTSVEGQIDNFVGIEEIEGVQSELQVLTSDFNSFVSTTTNQINEIQGDVRSLENATAQLQTGLSDLEKTVDEFEDFSTDLEEIKGSKQINH